MLSTIAAFVIAAAEGAEEESSHTAFYVAGGVLACWAVIVSVIGFTRPEFPGTQAERRTVMALTVLLVVGAMSTAIITAG